MIEPILKWAGGKRSLIPEIISLLPKDYRNKKYHEPFFGGGALFFEIQPKSGSINDINRQLMNFYRVIRDKPEEIIELASSYKYEKEEFYKLRDKYNTPNLTDVEYASLLLYLNKTAFNGLYRVNSKGLFNVPFGRYKNPTIVDENRIKKASKALKNVEILNKDFSYVIDYSKKGDICYFDPPYSPLNKTAYFTSYSSDGFSWEDQIRLRDTCISLDKKGVLFVLSNSYVKELVEEYRKIDSFYIKTVKANRAINSKASNRGPINEILVTNILVK
ncbi:DNA adenine methylase [Candidatus Bathyarchaeota archaeon]|nr:DNA adenine methylase [Candidatus Bathyarchaeota archaeon]